jgi:hypothetical protein
MYAQTRVAGAQQLDGPSIYQRPGYQRHAEVQRTGNTYNQHHTTQIEGTKGIPPRTAFEPSSFAALVVNSGRGTGDKRAQEEVLCSIGQFPFNGRGPVEENLHKGAVGVPEDDVVVCFLNGHRA